MPQIVFLQAFAKIGLVPDAGGSFFLPRLVGNARALGLAMLANSLPAETAATLEAMRGRWPNFESAEGHLLYARALAGAGRIDEALDEFQAVSEYFPGAEARVRYALLLDQLGRAAEARVVFAELLIQMKRAPKYVRKVQASWLAVAEKYLAA